ncbi:hypothetical protein FRC05_005309 [Tulasnella sp. 425]|nr:hypothetical protein FRC05_005309 [Tulasnella sp. 425]
MMNITVTNNTQFPVLLNGTVFYPGKYGTLPATPISPEESIAYKLENSNLGGGVNGGNSWMVILDNGVTWCFATGWISPVGEIDEQQAGVAESCDPEAGNRAATPKGNKIVSTATFKDKDGLDIKFIASAIPNLEFDTILFAVEAGHPI